MLYLKCSNCFLIATVVTHPIIFVAAVFQLQHGTQEKQKSRRDVTHQVLHPVGLLLNGPPSLGWDALYLVIRRIRWIHRTIRSKDSKVNLRIFRQPPMFPDSANLHLLKANLSIRILNRLWHLSMPNRGFQKVKMSKSQKYVDLKYPFQALDRC